AHAHAHTHTHTYTYTHSHSHTHTRTRTRTRTPAHTTHTHHTGSGQPHVPLVSCSSILLASCFKIDLASAISCRSIGSPAGYFLDTESLSGQRSTRGTVRARSRGTVRARLQWMKKKDFKM